MTLRRPFYIAVCALSLATFAHASPATQAAPTLVSSNAIEDVGIDQHLGERLPLDLHFRDESGDEVRLAKYFHGRPVIFTLVYFECPMLCTVTLNQLTRSLNAMKESAGEEFEVIAVSFDPRDTPAIAAAKKMNYLRSYRRPSAEAGWHLLTGDQASIDALTKAAGFRYRWDAAQHIFVHAGATMILTPDGKLSRYFLGVDYPPTEVSAALHAAARGDVGRPAEAVYFYCLRYDPETGRYGLIVGRALRVMAIGSVLGVIGLGFGLQRFVSRRARRSAVMPA